MPLSIELVSLVDNLFALQIDVHKEKVKDANFYVVSDVEVSSISATSFVDDNVENAEAKDGDDREIIKISL